MPGLPSLCPFNSTHTALHACADFWVLIGGLTGVSHVVHRMLFTLFLAVAYRISLCVQPCWAPALCTGYASHSTCELFAILTLLASSPSSIGLSSAFCAYCYIGMRLSRCWPRCSECLFNSSRYVLTPHLLLPTCQSLLATSWWGDSLDSVGSRVYILAVHNQFNPFATVRWAVSNTSCAYSFSTQSISIALVGVGGSWRKPWLF